MHIIAVLCCAGAGMDIPIDIVIERCAKSKYHGKY